MVKKKDRKLQIRCDETFLRKLLAICAETGRSKTAVIEDLVTSEYAKNKKYERWYYANLDKNV